MITIEERIRELKRRGFKMTPQRRAIIEALHNDTSHPTAEDVYNNVKKTMPDISLATVYNTLELLHKIGGILKLEVIGGKAHYDPFTKPHIHLVCTMCGRIVDVEKPIPEMELSKNERKGFKIKGFNIVFYGVCPNCQRKMN